MSTPEVVELCQPGSRCSPTNTKDNFQARSIRAVKALPGLGLVLVLIASVFFSVASLTIKLIPNVHPLMILLGRSIIQLTLFLPPCIYYQYSFFGKKGERLALLLRIIFGTMAIAGLFFAVRLLPLADATTIIFSSPAFTTLFACVFLHEACGIFNVASVVCVLVGVVLVSKPTFLFGGTTNINQLEGSLAALTATVFQAVVLIFLRKLRRTPSSVIIVTFSMAVTIVCGVALSIMQETALPLCGAEGVWFVLCGVTSAIGQYLLTAATKIEKAGPVSVVRTFDIIMAFFFQISLLGQYPMWNSILGALIIFSTVVALGLKRWYKEKPNLFSCILPATVESPPV